MYRWRALLKGIVASTLPNVVATKLPMPEKLVSLKMCALATIVFLLAITVAVKVCGRSSVCRNVKGAKFALMLRADKAKPPPAETAAN